MRAEQKIMQRSHYLQHWSSFPSNFSFLNLFSLFGTRYGSAHQHASVGIFQLDNKIQFCSTPSTFPAIELLRRVPNGTHYLIPQ